VGAYEFRIFYSRKSGNKPGMKGAKPETGLMCRMGLWAEGRKKREDFVREV